MRVGIQVERSKFGQVLGDMREWLDHHGGDPVKFGSATLPSGYILIALDFARADLAVAFRRDWADALIDEPALAA